MSITPHSTGTGRPAKPYPGFPLYAHTNGQWAKKICGRTHCFGLWEDSHGALKRYLEQKDDLEAGRRPQRESDCTGLLTVEQMVYLCLSAKKLMVEAGAHPRNRRRTTAPAPRAADLTPQVSRPGHRRRQSAAGPGRVADSAAG